MSVFMVVEVCNDYIFFGDFNFYNIIRYLSPSRLLRFTLNSVLTVMTLAFLLLFGRGLPGTSVSILNVHLLSLAFQIQARCLFGFGK